MNSGLVTPDNIDIDIEHYSKYVQGKTALVAQGGGQRGIFTAGVMDAFLLSNFDPFDEFYGTSAGALNLCAYLCRQPGLSKSFIVELTTAPEFFNLFGYIRKKQSMDLDWALERIQEYPYKLDLDLGKSALRGRGAFAAVTDTQNLNDRYLPIICDEWFSTLLATCAIPKLYSMPVGIGDRHYVDGGISASIPVQEAWRRNARSVIVIRTEPHSPADEQSSAELIDSQKPDWMNERFFNVQDKWQQKISQWKTDWSNFLQHRLEVTKMNARRKSHSQSSLNGGRWLFGADDVFRLGHLLGDKFDNGLADMLMVHYQTYALTLEFINRPPDDTFIVQIAPEQALKSHSLLSKKEDLLHDYELGLKAGYRFIEQYNLAQSESKVEAAQRFTYL